MTALVVMFVVSGCLLIGLSIPLIRRMVPPNHWYGVRIAATLRDERVWYEVNAYGGWCLLISGIIWTASAVVFALLPGVTPDGYSIIMLVVLAVTLIPALALMYCSVQQSQSAEPAPNGEHRV